MAKENGSGKKKEMALENDRFGMVRTALNDKCYTVDGKRFFKSRPISTSEKKKLQKSVFNISVRLVCRYLQMKLLLKCKRARERIFLAVHSYHLRYKLMEWTIEIHSAASEGDVEFLTSLLDIENNLIHF